MYICYENSMSKFEVTNYHVTLHKNGLGFHTKSLTSQGKYP